MENFKDEILAAAEAEFFDGHACLTGDCPHEKQRDCFIAAFTAGVKHSPLFELALLTLEDCVCYCEEANHVNGLMVDSICARCSVLAEFKEAQK